MGMSKGLGGLMIAVLSVSLGCQPAVEKLQQRQLEKARNALRQGQYEQALFALDAIENTPMQSREHHLIRGLAYFKLREFHHAMDAFEKAEPASTSLQSRMSYLHLFLGETEAAAAFVDASRAAREQTPALDVLRGNMKLWERAFDDARALFRQVASTVDQPVHAYMGLANAALLEQDLGAAEQYYLSALLASPDDIHTYLVLVPLQD